MDCYGCCSTEAPRLAGMVRVFLNCKSAFECSGPPFGVAASPPPGGYLEQACQGQPVPSVMNSALPPESHSSVFVTCTQRGPAPPQHCLPVHPSPLGLSLFTGSSRLQEQFHTSSIKSHPLAFPTLVGHSFHWEVFSKQARALGFFGYHGFTSVRSSNFSCGLGILTPGLGYTRNLEGKRWGRGGWAF